MHKEDQCIYARHGDQCKRQKKRNRIPSTPKFTIVKEKKLPTGCGRARNRILKANIEDKSEECDLCCPKHSEPMFKRVFGDD